MHPWAIFVEGLKNWRINWLKLAGIYLLIYIPLTVLDVLLTSKDGSPSLVQMASGIIHWALDAFVMASLILSAKEHLNATVSKVMDTLKASLKYLVRYMFTTLLYSVIAVGIVLLAAMVMSFLFTSLVKTPGITVGVLMAIIAMIACVAAVVYCVIRFSLSGIICIMEEVGPVESLKTSHSLIKKSVPSVLGVFFFMLLLTGLLFVPAILLNSVIVSNSAGSILSVIYQVLAGAVTFPVWVSVMVILYKRLKETVS